MVSPAFFAAAEAETLRMIRSQLHAAAINDRQQNAPHRPGGLQKL
jgi:hypothetical protein